MKQINARVSDKLHRAVKMKAAQEGKTMTEVIVTLLKKWLEEEDDGMQILR
jgi:predicted HicB family RNase H-like nuclease